MSTYRKIHGRSIQAVTTDPTGEITEGQVWYNTTSDTFKSVLLSKAFASSTPYPIAVFGNMGAGTQTAALSFGGTADPSTPSSPLTLTVEYNGSGWATGGDMSQKRRSGFGFGTQTAALGSTGYTYPETNKTEHYNGTSWTNGGNYPVSQELGGGCGTQTAGLACGGGPGPSPVGISNEYDGSSWTASPGALNSARKGITVTGIQTAGLAASAADSPTATACEEYNGSTWTTVNSMNTPRATLSFGSGIQTASILYGTPGSLESYDGTNWTNEPATMGNARNSGASAGTATASLASCGSPGAFTSHVEEYNQSVNVITAAAAWASGGNLNTSRDEGASSQNGLQTAALYFGGYKTDPAYNGTEQYDGTSWTAKNNINTARYSGAGAGTTTAALYSGGFSNPSTRQSAVEEWDGTNWATQPNSLSTGRNNCGGCGTQTAALVYGGDEPADSDKTELYDGTSWTNGGALSTARSHVMGGVGISTAAICVGGKTPGSNFLTTTEEYGGSSWTSGGALVTGSENGGGAGTATDAIIFGGSISPGSGGYTGITQGYDGTAFSTRPTMATARNYVSGTGTSTAGVAFGGNSHPSYTTATEEFTGETTSLNIKDLTQS